MIHFLPSTNTLRCSSTLAPPHGILERTLGSLPLQHYLGITSSRLQSRCSERIQSLTCSCSCRFDCLSAALEMQLPAAASSIHLAQAVWPVARQPKRSTLATTPRHRHLHSCRSQASAHLPLGCGWRARVRDRT